MLLRRSLAVALLGLGLQTCAPPAALKSAVKNDSVLSGARELTVVGSDDDSFALANALRKLGFTVKTAKEKSAVEGDLLLEISGCCPNPVANFCDSSLNVELTLVPKGQKLYQAVIEDGSECPSRFFSAVAKDLDGRWKR